MASNKPSNKRRQYLLVAAVLSLGILITALLLIFKPSAQRVSVDHEPPKVDVLLALAQDIRIPVRSQGSVQAQTQIQVAAEVSGKVVWVSDSLIIQGFFNKDELLLSIDDHEYTLLITKAEAQVAAARQLLARTEAEADQARKDLQRLGRNLSKSSEYALKIPHLKEARANLKAAEADLAIARLQRQRTQLHAPFAGRLIKKYVDVGQFVAPGSALLDIYSSESAEVRVPLTQSQLSLLNLPIQDPAPLKEVISDVVLTASFAGITWRWQGRLTRTEGVIDERNRLLYAVVLVEKPNRVDPEQPGRPALTSGQFVNVIIQGRQQRQVYVLPRSALRYGRELWLVDDQNRLQKRQVGVMHKEKLHVYISSGLESGERVITSALDIAIENMQLEPRLQNSGSVFEVVQ